MLTLTLLGLLALGVIFLGAALVFLYRWIVRSKLFPQLPRLWRGDRTRFALFLALFLVCTAGFTLAGAFQQETAQPPAQPALDLPDKPSFDGAPPPDPSVLKAPTQGDSILSEEKVLPPSGQSPAPVVDAPAQPDQQMAQATPDQTVEQAAPPAQAAPVESAATQAKQKETPEPKAPAEPAQTQAQPEPVQAKEAPESPEPAPKPAAPAPAPAPAAPELHPAPQAAKPAAPEKPAPKPAPKQAAPKQAALKQAEQKTQPAPKAEPKPAPEAAPDAPAIPKGKYTVCLASFRKKAAAQAYAKQLNAKQGIDAFVVAVNLKGKGKWHRVCAGGYPTSGEASKAAGGLKAKLKGATPFPTRLPKPE